MLITPRLHPIGKRGSILQTNRRRIIGGGGHTGPAGYASYEDAVADLGASNHWSMQETGTPAFAIDSISAHNMTLFGATKPTVGNPGLRPDTTCYYFDGLSSMLSHNGIGVPLGWANAPSDYSFSFLMQMVGVAHDGVIIRMQTGVGESHSLIMTRADTGKFQVDKSPSSAGTSFDNISNTPNVVWHLVYTESQANGRAFYVNGIQVVSDASYEAYSGAANTQFFIGSLGASLYYKGYLQDVSLWLKELSQEDVAALYASTGL